MVAFVASHQRCSQAGHRLACPILRRSGWLSYCVARAVFRLLLSLAGAVEFFFSTSSSGSGGVHVSPALALRSRTHEEEDVSQQHGVRRLPARSSSRVCSPSHTRSSTAQHLHLGLARVIFLFLPVAVFKTPFLIKNTTRRCAANLPLRVRRTKSAYKHRLFQHGPRTHQESKKCEENHRTMRSNIHV